VERELRVAARRGTTHWARFGLTVVVALITMNYFAASGSANPGNVGRSAFVWLMSAAFVLACAACALTADTLSAEQREGTLGLLFLTDLRTWDITLGKLVSAGLGAAYAGIAFVPLLMLPLLAGGVTGAEAARTGVALLATLLFALAAGLAASAREIDRLRALRQAALWVTGAVILPAVAAWAGALFPLLALLGLLSPLTTLRLAQDTAFAAAPAEFWASLSLQLLHAALLLLRAGRRVRRSLVEPTLHATPPPPREPVPYSTEPFSNASYRRANPRRPRPRRSFDEVRPLEWLVQRQRGQKALCWTAALLLIASAPLALALYSLRLLTFAGPTPPLAWHSLSQLWWVGDALLAWAASRFFFEARRSGELELLLTTPAGAQALVSAHWAAMKRLLLWPMVLVFTPMLLQAGGAVLALGRGLTGAPAIYQLYSGFYAFLRPVEVFLVVLALNWLGMLFGLTLRRMVSAVALTLALVIGLPMMVRFLFQLVLRPFFDPSPGSSNWLVWSFCYYPITYALLLALTWWARQRLRHASLGEPLHPLRDLRLLVKGPWSGVYPAQAGG
jgi:hypothetical protein